MFGRNRTSSEPAEEIKTSSEKVNIEDVDFAYINFEDISLADVSPAGRNGSEEEPADRDSVRSEDPVLPISIEQTGAEPGDEIEGREEVSEESGDGAESERVPEAAAEHAGETAAADEIGEESENQENSENEPEDIEEPPTGEKENEENVSGEEDHTKEESGEEGLNDRSSLDIGSVRKKKTARKSASSRYFPSKDSLNLATVGIKKINPGVAMPLIVLIILGAALLSKVAVVDRLADVNRAEAEESALQSEVDAISDEIDSYGDLKNSYAHYTYSGMTDEELTRADRVAVIDLIDRVVTPKASIGKISITDNTLIISVSGATLQEINLIAQELEKDDLVSLCIVSDANTIDEDDSADIVTGQLIAYLNERGQEDEQ